MADLIPRDRLLPSLLDRLTNDTPDARQEAPGAKTWSPRQAHQAVVRDLAWLLNTHCRPESDNLQEFPEVARSTLNYGIPDLCGLTASGVDPSRLQRSLLHAIQRFEPRVIRQTLTVTAADMEASHGNAIVLEIKGQVWATPVPDTLYLKTEVDLESGQISLQDKQYGQRAGK